MIKIGVLIKHDEVRWHFLLSCSYCNLQGVELQLVVPHRSSLPSSISPPHFVHPHAGPPAARSWESRAGCCVSKIAFSETLHVPTEIHSCPMDGNSFLSHDHFFLLFAQPYEILLFEVQSESTFEFEAETDKSPNKVQCKEPTTGPVL
jgi:hypothetical protein